MQIDPQLPARARTLFEQLRARGTALTAFPNLRLFGGVWMAGQGQPTTYFGHEVVPPAALWLSGHHAGHPDHLDRWLQGAGPDADPTALGDGNFAYDLLMLSTRRVDVAVDVAAAIEAALLGVVDDPGAWARWLASVSDRPTAFARPLGQVELPAGAPAGVDELGLRDVLARIGTWSEDGSHFPRWQGAGRVAPGDLSPAYVEHNILGWALPTGRTFVLAIVSGPARGGAHPCHELLMELRDDGSWARRVVLTRAPVASPINDFAFFTVGLPASTGTAVQPPHRVSELVPGSPPWQTRYDLVERFLDVGFEQGGGSPKDNEEVVPAELVAESIRSGNVDLVILFVGIAEWGVSELPEELEDPYMHGGRSHGWQHTRRTGKSITDYDPWASHRGWRHSHGGLGIVHLDSGGLQDLYRITRGEDVGDDAPTHVQPMDRDGNPIPWSGALVAPDFTAEIRSQHLNFDDIADTWAEDSEQGQAYRAWGLALTRDRSAQHFFIDMASERFVHKGLFVAPGDDRWRSVFQDPYLRVMYGAVVSSTRRGSFERAIDGWREGDGDIFHVAALATNDGDRTRGYTAQRAAVLARYYGEGGAAASPGPSVSDVTAVYLLLRPAQPSIVRGIPWSSGLAIGLGELELDPTVAQPVRLLLPDGSRAAETSGLSSDGERLFVAQAGRDRILEFDPAQLPAAGAEATLRAVAQSRMRVHDFDPEGIAVAGEGSFFVVDEEQNRVARVEVDGSATTIAGIWRVLVEGARPNQGLEGAHFDPATRRLYVVHERVTEQTSRRLLVFEVDETGMLHAEDDVAQPIADELADAFAALGDHLPRHLGGVFVSGDQLYVLGRPPNQILQIDMAALSQSGYEPTRLLLAEVSAELQPTGDHSWSNEDMQPEGICIVGERVYVCADVETDETWGALWVYRRRATGS